MTMSTFDLASFGANDRPYHLFDGHTDKSEASEIGVPCM